MQYAGTPNYMAPELFQKRNYDDGVDVFAFGTLLWELVWREIPYDGFEAHEIKQKIESGEPLKINYGVDQRILNLITDCRKVNRHERPSFRHIVQTLATVVPVLS